MHPSGHTPPTGTEGAQRSSLIVSNDQRDWNWDSIALLARARALPGGRARWFRTVLQLGTGFETEMPPSTTLHLPMLLHLFYPRRRPLMLSHLSIWAGKLAAVQVREGYSRSLDAPRFALRPSAPEASSALLRGRFPRVAAAKSGAPAASPIPTCPAAFLLGCR